jgi:DNA-binding HxlR family transcriptional regulator
MVNNGQRGRPVLRLLAEGWMVAILAVLAEGQARPSELERRLPGVPHAVVMRRLNQLLACGAATRRRSRGRPPRVHYALTAPGRELVTLAADAAAWESRYGEPPAGDPRRNAPS